MHIKNEGRIEHGVFWKVEFNHNWVTIIARNIRTGRSKVCDYECSYNYRDGYDQEDIIEIYRIIDDFVNELRED